jgi:3-deoxy-D-manno-octulosonic-acid transferase
MRIAALVYTLLYGAVLTVLLPYQYLKRPQETRKRWLRERLGSYRHRADTPSHNKTIWIHAVSVGESIAAVPLIKKLKEAHPALRIVLSTVTDTGQEVARERVGEYAEILYVPFDLPSALKSAVRHIRPSVLVIMETELWPNMVEIVSGCGVPVLLMNGRISGKSLDGYKKIRPFIRNMLGDVTLFCMQDDLYAERIRGMGADTGKVRVTGNFKFDTRPSSAVPEWTRILTGPVIIAGSTHRTEEELVLDAFSNIAQEFPEASLIIAPRHPERFKEVEDLIKKKGLAYMKRSERKESEEAKQRGLVVLLDVMGELSTVYGAADIAVLGGSFIEHGGQNPLEPAYWAKAIVCGPHMENFPFIDNFYLKGGALRVEAASLGSSLMDLLSSPDKRAAMGRRARELYDKNAGATGRAMEILERYL